MNWCKAQKKHKREWAFGLRYATAENSPLE